MHQLLIAVKSSFQQLENGTHAMIRATWAQQFRGLAHVRFFLGRPTQSLGGMVKSLPASEDLVATTRNSYVPANDEVVLDCQDYSMVKKTRGICGYAMGKNITHVLLVNAHTNVGVKQTLRAPFEIADYAGDFGDTFGTLQSRAFWNGEQNEEIRECYGWAKADSGIFLSRKAMAEIAETSPKLSLCVTDQNDDVWIGNVLGPEVQRGNLLAMPTEAVAA